MKWLFLSAALLVKGLDASDSFIGPTCPLTGFCANAFSNFTQTILPGNAALMEEINVQTRDVDLLLTPLVGDIVLNQSGIYKIAWSAQAKPTFSGSWSLGLTLGHVVVAGSVYGGTDNIPQNVGGSVLISITAPQVLRLSNISSVPLDLVSSAGPSVSLCIALIEIAQ